MVDITTTLAGVGFDPAGLFPGHRALQSMRERAAAVGGDLAIAGLSGHGTAIRACIPAKLPPADPAGSSPA